MRVCAFLTTDNLEGYVYDDELARAPLAALGWEVRYVPWRQPPSVWDAFDAVVIRTPWDYQRAPDAFLATLAAIEARGVPLANSLRLARWNIRKSYLTDLAAQGAPIPPTLWPSSLAGVRWPEMFDALETDEIVLKPLISASAHDTYRLHRADAAAQWPSLLNVFNERPLLVQAFQTNIVTEGEYSLIYLGHAFSHALLKTPRAGDFRSQEEYGSRLELITPPEALLDLGRRALAALPEPTLYARLDVVRLGMGGFAVMELELIEPALYFRMGPGSADRFAAAVNAWFERRPIARRRK